MEGCSRSLWLVGVDGSGAVVGPRRKMGRGCGEGVMLMFPFSFRPRGVLMGNSDIHSHNNNASIIPIPSIRCFLSLIVLILVLIPGSRS